MPRASKKKRAKTSKRKSPRRSRRSKKQAFWKKAGIWLAKGLFVTIPVFVFRSLKNITLMLVSAGTKKAKQAKTKRERSAKRAKRYNEEAQLDPFTLERKLKGSLKRFENKLARSKSSIGLILGARGSGKSALAMRLLENIHCQSGKSLYAMGFKEESLPLWINAIRSTEEITNNSIVLIDEGGIEFSSRSSMSEANKVLSELLLIARHKDLSVLFITQNSSNLEINVIRQADYLLLKPSSLLQKDFERKKIKEVYEAVAQDFEELKDLPGLFFIYSDQFQGFVSNSLPSFWSEKVSKGYAQKKV